MSLSKRHSIHWPESETKESEPTDTLVITSSKGYFVDIRINKSQENNKFDWFFAGLEIEIDSTNFEFNHDFLDSKLIGNLNYISNKDIGSFSNSLNLLEFQNGIRLENGVMLNSNTGKKEKYIEKWITCNPNNRNLEFLGYDNNLSNIKCIVLDTIFGGAMDNQNNNDISIGRLIIYGNWMQGIVWDKSIKKDANDNDALNCVGILRAYINNDFSITDDGLLISFGNRFELLPELHKIKKCSQIGDLVIQKNVTWVVKEIENWPVPSKL